MIDYTSQPKDNNFSINKHSLQAIFGIPGVVFYDSLKLDYFSLRHNPSKLGFCSFILTK